METLKTLEVNVHNNGIVRIYGNGGLIFETKGEYVKVITNVDPQPVQLSGVQTTKIESDKGKQCQ